RPQPIQITFGQPNIWSLEQAHYLLSQMRERSLGINAKALNNLDPNTAEGTRINLLRQLFELSGEYRQSPSLPDPQSSPSPTPAPMQTPVPFPSPAAAANSPFANTVTAELLKNSEFIKKLFSDSKLNATTQLDNHIQLQYEIIAKQLTLLRDEVGPDERLVFLELPQSIYASANDTEGKVAQTYWEVSGYEREEEEKIKYRADKIGAITANIVKVKNSFGLDSLTAETCKEFRKQQLEDQEKPASKDSETDEQKETKRKSDEICSLYEGLSEITDNENDRIIREVNSEIQRLKQNGTVPNDEIVEKSTQRILSKRLSNLTPKNTLTVNNQDIPDTSTAIIPRSLSTRAVDIIPRQSSLNITDIQETVKSFSLAGAFSWLFGLGLRSGYQRQRDTFEQYLHQDIYASGFGKGDRTFGWTFGPIPGTKRIAPGIRTTYAVVVVPRKAESLILKARGCYFPRKNYQPQNVMSENDDLQSWRKENKRNCFKTEQFTIPIPNSGDSRGFWLTAVDYTPSTVKNQKIVISINGENFTSQVGILVNGVPLQQAVELTRKLTDDSLSREYCDSNICGRYEVIDSNEITAVFKMPEDYTGKPEITVIGPGRAVPLNSLKIAIRVNGDKMNKCKDSDKKPIPCMLKSAEVPPMFGTVPEGPNAKLTLGKLKFFPENPASKPTSGLLTGTKFSNLDKIYINGTEVTNEYLKATENLLRFPVNLAATFTDSVTVTLKRCVDKEGKVKDFASCNTVEPGKDKYESETSVFAVPSAQFTVMSVVGLSFDDIRDEMFIRIEGIGLDNTELGSVNGAAPTTGSKVIAVSSRELLIKINKPESVVKITLKNPKGNEVNSVIVRPPVKDIVEQ
ncbi:MAG TPA: hypothetical protein VGD05_09105, partial [Pyrinomonadaceae bacterium]